MLSKPHHGGRLNEAAEQWGIPREQWLDLSTGINPIGWPVPELPADIWQRLPEPDDGLEAIIQRWAGAPESATCLAVSGSQAAIMALPGLRKSCRVGVPVPGYREHGFWWAEHGHRVQGVSTGQMASDDETWLDALDVLVCINPNNPDGRWLSAGRLARWHQRLAARGGWLVVDEAFIDDVAGGQSLSMAAFTGQPGLVVMRSLGKFFGLAGLRAGAVLTSSDIAGPLADALGPWAVSGPARYLMSAALTDSQWQVDAGDRLRQDSQRLHDLLVASGFSASSGTLLFRYVQTDHASRIADDLASKGILVRRFNSPSALRFGLPGSESQWQKLARALSEQADLIDQ